MQTHPRTATMAVCPSTLSIQVREFMVAVGQDASAKSPTVPEEAIVRLRARLIAEEAFETLRALLPHAHLSHLQDLVMRQIDDSALSNRWVDMVGLADGCADLDYVVEGTRIAFGIHGVPIANRVHLANMSKLGGPIVEGKQMKPEGWQPPDIAAALRAQGWTG